MKTDLNYSNTDVFETFPFPPADALPALERIGEAYHETRRAIMLNPQEGLTTTYNRFHDPSEWDADIQALRDLHRQMDEAVMVAYGWDDLDLGHGYHDTAQGIRYTISEAARRDVLKRLLALNFERYEEEQRLGAGVSVGKKKRPYPLSPSPLGEGEQRNGVSAQTAAEDDPNAPPPEQTSFLDDDSPKQRRLL